jgi:aminodeoxyfutalosine deaminase
VALGTDSRASNPDLNLWEEMRFVAGQHPAVSPAEILAMGTASGAKALGLTDRGTLEVGKRADLAIIALGNDIRDDPHKRLLAPGTRVVQTWIAGQRVAG